MARNEEGLKKALTMVNDLKNEFWKDVKVPGTSCEFNQELEKAVRIASAFELSQVLIKDALSRKESCGAHYREEFVTEDGEAKRNDEEYMYVSAWEYQGENKEPKLHKEELKFEFVEVKQRSYK